MPRTKATAAEPAKTLTDKNVLRFRYKKNQMVPALAEYTKDGNLAMPPASSRLVESREIIDPIAPSGSRVLNRMANFYDLDFEHELVVPDHEPRAIVKRENQSELWHARLMDREMERALEATDYCDKLRRLLEALQSQGVIEVTHDPSGLLNRSPFLSDEEADQKKRADDEERAVKMMTMANLKTGSRK